MHLRACVPLVLAVSVVLALVPARVNGLSCGGSCLDADCPECVCDHMYTEQVFITQEQIRAYCSDPDPWRADGGTGPEWDVDECVCIVNAESRGDLNAINYNPSGASYDVGLWQINTINWETCSFGTGNDPPCSPEDNLVCAMRVYKWGGSSWRHWATEDKCVGRRRASLWTPEVVGGVSVAGVAGIAGAAAFYSKRRRSAKTSGAATGRRSAGRRSAGYRSAGHRSAGKRSTGSRRSNKSAKA